SFEFRQGGRAHFVPLGNVDSHTPWSVGHEHALRIEHDPRLAGWSIAVDGRTVAAVPLDDDHHGLAHPHVFLSVRNTGGRCDNHGTLLFSHVYVKSATTGAWVPFEGQAAVQIGHNAQNIREETLSPTSFAIGTA